MAILARVQSGVVAELFTPPVGRTVNECFVQAVAAQFVDVTAVSPTPEPGWAAIETNGAWTFAAPAAPAADMRSAAKIALDKSDTTIIRCYEHGVAVPADWTAYRATLRAIVSGRTTAAPLPAAPAYPAGT